MRAFNSSFLRFTCCTLVCLCARGAFAASTRVLLNKTFPPGSIVIVKDRFALYYIEEDNYARKFPIAAPKATKTWSGHAVVMRKDLQPAWAPPAEVKRDHPKIPDYIPGGARNNPMGAAAISLDREEIAIHGTSPDMRKSIGTYASYGCIRMRNEDVLELYELVDKGTDVYMR